jgi:hypothetical protein
VSPVKYELGFYIPEDDILHSHCREIYQSCAALCIHVLITLAVVGNGRQLSLPLIFPKEKSRYSLDMRSRNRDEWRGKEMCCSCRESNTDPRS